MLKNRKAEQKLKQLWERIPAFKCVEGCTACCGPVPWSEFERSKLLNPKPHSDTCLICPYANDGQPGCSVRDERPILCRLFGVVDHPLMTCTKGGIPERVLSEEEGNVIMQEYFQLFPWPK